MKFDIISSVCNQNITLLGGANKRRNDFNTKVKHPFTYIWSFDHVVIGRKITETKINLNLHAYDNSSYSEMARMAYFLSNDCFFISEQFPFRRINIPMFKTPKEYDSLIEQYINNPALRQKKAEEMGKEFRRNFDMRDILRKVL